MGHSLLLLGGDIGATVSGFVVAAEEEEEEEERRVLGCC